MVRPNTILQTDALTGLRLLPDESVDCVVTSPPYWGLRAYGTTLQIWDGDKNCKHEWSSREIWLHRGSTKSKINGNAARHMTNVKAENNFCVRCGAWRGELGLEPVFELYVKHLYGIFDEVWRVLKAGGSCWVNLGDTYGGGRGERGNTTNGIYSPAYDKVPWPKGFNAGMPKCLLQIPSRFAIEMCCRGWMLRNRIIWHKPNCMPSSAQDRFTVDFEELFFFTKRSRYYFETQHEPCRERSIDRMESAQRNDNPKEGSRRHAVPNGMHGRNPSGRNKRCVWTIPPRSFPEAHFAVFPEALVETPIKAGCPEWVCRSCGSPKRKVVRLQCRTDAFNIRVRDVKEGRIKHIDRVASPEEVARYDDKTYASRERDLVVSQGCSCGAGFRPGLVLDPFAGAGTTCLVAMKLGRDFIGFDLKPEYVEIARRRLISYQSQRLLALVHGSGREPHNGKVARKEVYALTA